MANESFASNRIPMLCAENSGIARKQTLQEGRRKYTTKSCFDVQNKTIWGRDQRFFAVVLSKIDLGNVDT